MTEWTMNILEETEVSAIIYILQKKTALRCFYDRFFSKGMNIALFSHSKIRQFEQLLHNNGKNQFW